MKRILLSIFCILSMGTNLSAQTSFKERALAYIIIYQDWAILEQIRSGVPASITLAQGILETAAGESELCNNANNHFGIKCKSKWTGESYTYTDDAKDECFRKYKSAYESYKDHSDFLKQNPRYASLFLYTPIDYKSWAHGLKKCGYATNPQYAYKLIKFIEEYNLQDFTILAINKANGDQHRDIAEKKEDKKVEVLDASFENLGYGQIDSTPQVVGYYTPAKKNGLNGFYGKRGDLLLEYALQHRIRYSKLLFWNDLQDQPLPENMFIYTESKRKKGLNVAHTFQNGETLHSVAQEEGIQLAQLLFLNNLSEDNRPAEGSILYLQAPNSSKVALEHDGNKQAPNNPINRVKKETADDFIATERKVDIIEESEPIKVVVNAKQEEQKLEPVVERKNTTLEKANTNYEIVEAPTVPIKEQVQVVKEEVEYVETKSSKKTKEIEKDQTPLEKLKAYMDQTVYGEESSNELVTEAKKVESTKTKPTLPPAQQQANNAKVNTATTAVKPKSNKEIYHVVKRGETAFGISKQYGVSIAQIRTLNSLPSSMVVSVGQKLRIN